MVNWRHGGRGISDLVFKKTNGMRLNYKKQGQYKPFAKVGVDTQAEVSW
jgi:hypothetical protein